MKSVFKHPGAPAKIVIQQLNSTLRGWANYHKHIVSKEIFKEIDYYLWRLLGRWCKRRHPAKSWKWIRNKYFSASEECCSFSAIMPTKNGKKLKIYKIFRAGRVPIIRHVKIKSEANPFVKEHDKYLRKRYLDLKIRSNKTKQECIISKDFRQVNKNLLNLWIRKAV